MGKPCTVCAHPDRSAIDAALEGGRPLRRIAAAYGVSKTALHRHWQARWTPTATWTEAYKRWSLRNSRRGSTRTRRSNRGNLSRRARGGSS